MNDVFLPFGKFKGCALDEVDPGYLQWMLDKARQDDCWGGMILFVEAHREAILAAISDIQNAKLASISLDYTLSPSQKQASQFLQEWLLSDQRTAKLEGGAGYGKSFTVKDVLRFAMEQGYRVAATATSYVATQVLASDLEPMGVDVRTIARHLQLTVTRDNRQVNYVFSEKSPERLKALLSRGNLLVVDEYSMVGDAIGQALLDSVNLYGGKLLVVGDLKQLPPVKQDKDTCLAGIQCTIALSDPMRYDRESDLYKVEQIARTSPHDLLNDLDQWTDSKQVSVAPDENALIHRYTKSYSANEDSRILYFRRADVVTVNHRVRRALYGKASEQLVVEDEKLLVAATSDVYQDVYAAEAEFSPEKCKTNRFYSGTSFRVIHQHEDSILGVPCYVVQFEDGRETPVIFMVTETQADENTLGGPEYTRRLRELANEAKTQAEAGETPGRAWGPYHQFRKFFLPVMYGYAMTVHRCQGQTVDRAYIAPRTLINAGGPKIGEKLLYVAATRAKKHLTMVA